MTIFQNLQHRSLYLWNKQQKTFITLGIIVGLFLAILVVAFIAYKKDTLLTWVLAASIGGLGALILFRLSRFEYGIIAIMLTASLVNFFTLPTGRESRVVISLLVTMALVGLWILQTLISPNKNKITSSPIHRPVIFFVIVSLVSYVWSIMLRDPLVLVWESFTYVQLAALAVNILLPLLALMVSNKVKEERWLRYFSWVMIALGTFVVLAVLLNLGLDRIFRNGARGLFSTWVVSLALAFALYDEKLSRNVRGALLGLVLLWTYHSVFIEGHWLSGWLPFGVAGAIIVYNRSRQLFLLACIAGAVVVAVKWDAFYYRIYVSNVEEGSAQRTELWLPNIELISRHPVFGTGPAGYAVYYMTYHPHNSRSTHNNYFDILAQTGFVGFAVFLWLFGTAIAVGNRLRKRLAGRRDFAEAFANASFAALLAALAAMMLGDWVLPFAYNQTITGFDNASYTWIFIGGLISLYNIHRIGEKT